MFPNLEGGYTREYASAVVTSEDPNRTVRSLNGPSRRNSHSNSETGASAKPLWLEVISAFTKRLSPDMGTATRKGSSHEINQDSVLDAGPGCPLVAVADGISNSNHGEKASRAALMPLAISRPTSRKDLESIIFTCDAWVKESFSLFNAGRSGQTTLVAASIKRGAVVDFISIGDSRAYLLSPKGFLRRIYICEQITVDQTHGERKKRVTYKNPGSIRDDMMFHAVGAGLLANEVKAQRRIIPPGGMILLATDGLFKGMGDGHCEQIACIAARHTGKDATQLANSLVAEAAERFDTGDDISVAVIIPSYMLGIRWPYCLAAGFLMLTALIARVCC